MVLDVSGGFDCQNFPVRLPRAKIQSLLLSKCTVEELPRQPKALKLKIPMAQRGWLTKHPGKRCGMGWVYHFYRTRSETGQRVENTATVGSVSHFPREKDAWAEVERRHLIPNSGQNGIGRVTFRELVENYRKKSFNKL